jgi:hypothetical protein
MAVVISSSVELFPIILVTFLLLQYLWVLRGKSKIFWGKIRGECSIKTQALIVPKLRICIVKFPTPILQRTGYFTIGALIA